MGDPATDSIDKPRGRPIGWAIGGARLPFFGAGSGADLVAAVALGFLLPCSRADPALGKKFRFE